MSQDSVFICKRKKNLLDKQTNPIKALTIILPRISPKVTIYGQAINPYK